MERIAALERGRRGKFAEEIARWSISFRRRSIIRIIWTKTERLLPYPLGGDRTVLPDENRSGRLQKTAAEAIRYRLTDEQYRVTQEGATESPFRNEFWNQFESGCDWPAFSKPIEEPAVVELPDDSHGMHRTEVRSRAGDSHLGHVFTGNRESPNGVRYCINSASLRFVPYEKMEQEGYGGLLSLFDSDR